MVIGFNFVVYSPTNYSKLRIYFYFDFFVNLKSSPSISDTFPVLANTIACEVNNIVRLFLKMRVSVLPIMRIDDSETDSPVRHFLCLDSAFFGVLDGG